MKIVITAQNNTMESLVDPRLGRAKWFISVDTDTEAWEAHDNAANADAAQGAGVQSAGYLSKLGVSAVITGNVGPKAFTSLSAAGIKMYVGAEGTVRETVEQFKAGKFALVTKPNVEGRWA